MYDFLAPSARNSPLMRPGYGTYAGGAVPGVGGSGMPAASSNGSTDEALTPVMNQNQGGTAATIGAKTRRRLPRHWRSSRTITVMVASSTCPTIFRSWAGHLILRSSTLCRKVRLAST